MTTQVRTRFAPRPTGFLHLGDARTALYSWAFARQHGGDVRAAHRGHRRRALDARPRSRRSSTACEWLGLDYDEGPFYQMQRWTAIARSSAQMLAEGTAYHCYCTPEELDAMRERSARAARSRATTAAGAPSRARRCRRCPRRHAGGALSQSARRRRDLGRPRQGPDHDLQRRDSTTSSSCAPTACRPTTSASSSTTGTCRSPTSFRGDDHVNNTPRQINIFHALGAPLPEFAHVPMILGERGREAVASATAR